MPSFPRKPVQSSRAAAVLIGLLAAVSPVSAQATTRPPARLSPQAPQEANDESAQTDNEPQAWQLLRVVESATTSLGAVEVAVDPQAYAALWNAGAGRIDAVPLPDGRTLALELTAFPLLAPGAVLERVGPAGSKQVRTPELRFLRGRVRGEIDSRVVLTLFQGRVLGQLRIRDEAFGIGPEGLDLTGAGANRIRIWNRNTEVGAWSCAVEGASAPELGRLHEDFGRSLEDVNGTTEFSGLPQLALQLAVDSTTEWCAHFANDAPSAEAYLLSVVAQISSLYDAEIQVLVQVPFLRTFCGVADPYTDGLTLLADRGQLLDELETEWSTNMSGVDRTVAHLYTKSDQAGVSGGLANTHTCLGQNCSSVLCNTNSGYGVTMFPAAGGSPAGFEVSVAGHELGHNHSSPHTNCLQDASSQWISSCAIESCGSNPNCQSHGCYPGPEDDDIVGTMMSTGCNSRVFTIEDDTVEGILRGALESASCVGAAGLPGDVRDQTGDGLQVMKVASCPTQGLSNDDGSLNQFWGACGGCQYAWIKRFTPSCYPFRLTQVESLVPNVSPGRPLRLLVYADLSGSGDPANATLVYTEDVTVQVSDFSSFNSYTLTSPVTLPAGDFYFGFYDLQVDDPAPFIAPLDSSTSGDSYWAINATTPGAYTLRSGGTWMVRGQGGAVPAGSVLLGWGTPCNAATTPGQDFGVYGGEIPFFDQYTSLTCSTNAATTYFAESAPASSFFLVVPQTTPVEGSYGLDGSGAERLPAAVACKPQGGEACP